MIRNKIISGSALAVFFLLSAPVALAFGPQGGPQGPQGPQEGFQQGPQGGPQGPQCNRPGQPGAESGALLPCPPPNGFSGSQHPGGPMGNGPNPQGPKFGSGGGVAGPNLFSVLNPFMKQPDSYTAEEKKKIMDTVKVYLDGVKEVVTNTGLAMEDKVSKISALNTQFATDIKPYLDPAKVDAFSSFVTEKAGKPLMAGPGNGPNRQPGMDQKPNHPQGPGKDMNAGKKSLLSQKTRDAFNSKLDSLPQERKVELFKRIIAKIDALLNKTTNERVQVKLKELKDIVQMKLDEITTGTTDEGLMDEIFQGNIQ